MERNALISGYTDVTPFLFYFCNEVYNRLQVDAVPPKTDLEVYQTALAEGKITEKERLLWEYVLSAYGAEEFTTKQLEKDFRNAAYATIRTFVMKFHEMGCLLQEKQETGCSIMSVERLMSYHCNEARNSRGNLPCSNPDCMNRSSITH